MCGAILLGATLSTLFAQETGKYNVLFIISDDLTYTALSCYGNQVCKTPNIDRIAAQGVRFTRAFCQGTYCGPSRAAFMSGYYPHATGVLGYTSPRPNIGPDKVTWPQLFKNNDYYTARVGKLYHMGVPGGIEQSTDGSDDPLSWTEKFNCAGPEWKAPGEGETLESNPDGKRPVVGGNTFVVVEADGDEMVHADGIAAAKAVELIKAHKDKRFWLGVGFVRPHVPFVAPKKYFEPFKPYDKMVLPEKRPDPWANIPVAGINYKTSVNMKMDIRRQKKAVGGYYGAVSFMDAMVGRVLDTLEAEGLADSTIVIFTSDHGYHLGEHDFWAKVSLRDESSGVPLIIKVPGMKPAVCDSLVELQDLYPTISRLCGLNPPDGIQGKDIRALLTNPEQEVHEAIFCVAPARQGFLLRTHDFAYIQYAEDASRGMELYDLRKDPKQFTNLANNPEFANIVKRFQKQLELKLKDLRDNDLPPPPKKAPRKKAPKKNK
jgi:iduronate 2-sulfatase